MSCAGNASFSTQTRLHLPPRDITASYTSGTTGNASTSYTLDGRSPSYNHPSQPNTPQHLYSGPRLPQAHYTSETDNSASYAIASGKYKERDDFPQLTTMAMARR